LQIHVEHSNVPALEQYSALSAEAYERGKTVNKTEHDKKLAENIQWLVMGFE